MPGARQSQSGQVGPEPCKHTGGLLQTGEHRFVAEGNDEWGRALGAKKAPPHPSWDMREIIRRPEVSGEYGEDRLMNLRASQEHCNRHLTESQRWRMSLHQESEPRVLEDHP